MSTYQGGSGQEPNNPWGQQPDGAHFGQQPPASGTPGQAPYGQTPYGQPPYGQGPYAQGPYGGPPAYPGYAPQPSKSNMLGLVTLVVLVVAMIIGTAWTVPMYSKLEAHQGQDASTYPPAVTAYVVGCVALWLVGVLSFSLGIVATVTGRGRAFGIAAIVLSVLAPFLTVGIGMSISNALD